MVSTLDCYLENLISHIQMGTFVNFQTVRKCVHCYIFYNLVTYFGFLVLTKTSSVLGEISTYDIVWPSSVKVKKLPWVYLDQTNSQTNLGCPLWNQSAPKLGSPLGPGGKPNDQNRRGLTGAQPSAQPKTQFLPNLNQPIRPKTDWALSGLATWEG